MGVLSLHFKPNFLGLLKCLNKLNWVIVFFSLINLSVCIYEDQIGKFDWRQSYVGRIKFAQFDTVSTAKKLIVATEENVLAALNLKTGQVVWRHVFESTSTGNIQVLHVTDKVVTVSGANPYLVRGWDSTTGILLWEWSLLLHDDVMADYSEFWVQQGTLVHMLPVIGSHIELTVYNLWSGNNKGSTSKLPAPWVNYGCVLSAPYYTCISPAQGEGQRLISLDVTAEAVYIISAPLSEYLASATHASLRPLDGSGAPPAFLLDDDKILLLKDGRFEEVGVAVGDPAASVALLDGPTGLLVLQTWTDDIKGFQVSAHSAASGEELPEMMWSSRELRLPEPAISAALCSRAREPACRVLLTGADDAAHLVQQGGRVVWTREEALANVVAAEFVELPVSELDAALESEFDLKEGSVWSAFSRRLQTQLQQLQQLVQSMQRSEPASSGEPADLRRDYFNLHKIIVLVTQVGKIFGLDNLSGEILWRTYEPGLDTEGVAVFTQRSARHPPHLPTLTIVGKDEETGEGMIVSVNPVSGARAGNTVRVGARPLQVALLHRADRHKLHALLLLDTHENVHVFPETAAPLVENMFMYVAERDTARAHGYALTYNGQRVVAQKTWSVYLGGAQPGARIVSVASKPAWERVHSAGAVLGDRSVLYKYSNPNLVLFVVDAPDPIHKDMVVATCVDGVSGAVVGGAVHRRARALPLAVHMDNALAYMYYNDKHRRTELASMELYEGKERWVGAGAAFSSLAAWRAPALLRQAYILPSTPTAAANTHTDNSLTDKHLLLALPSGGVVELPWRAVEPRRGAAAAEEGVLPYAPELPLPADAVVNYNRSVVRVRHIYCAPSGLESTSLVLAAGLDLFYTRVAPSKTFDLLKEDFDYYLISIVLTALFLATYTTKYFAARKMLKMAWK